MFTFKAPSKKKRRKDIKIRQEEDEDEDHDHDQDDKNDMVNNDNDDSDEYETRKRIMNQKKDKRKKKRKLKKNKDTTSSASTPMSFSLGVDVDEDNDEDEKDEKEKKSKRSKDKKSKKRVKKTRKSTTRGGMGFGGMIPSHLNDEEDDDNDGDYISQKRIRGFGSMMKSSLESIIHDDDDHDNENRMANNNQKDDGDDDKEGEKDEKLTASLYGKEALERLKAEQKTYEPNATTAHIETSKSNPPPLAAAAAAAASLSSSNNAAGNVTTKIKQSTVVPNNKYNEHIPLPPLPSALQKPKPPTVDEDENDGFIAFDSSSTSINNNNNVMNNMNILTGDEALLYTGEYEEGDGELSHSMKQKISKAALGTQTLSNISSSSKTKSKNDNDLSLTSQILISGVIGNNNSCNDDKKKNGSGNDSHIDHTKDSEVDEGGRQWEEEIARRAGVGVGVSATANETNISTPTSSSTTPPPTHGQGKQTIATDDKCNKSVISNVTTTIKTTLENLNQMEEDLESNIGRRTHDQEISQKDANQKELELKEIGDKFEYYQNLRIEMVNWIGALRYVSDRVSIVEKAIIDLYYDIAMKHEQNWREWEDDVIATLVEKKMLDYVVGRQPKIESKNDEISVDEFGRDRRSLESLVRTKRREKRQRVRAESKDRRVKSLKRMKQQSIANMEAQAYEDSDLDVSDNELMDREERRSAYSDAIRLVINETEEEYSTPLKLLSTFKTWRMQNKADYDQCYANLALTDLMNVFIRVESCEKLDLICFIKEKKDTLMSMENFSWFTALQEFNVSSTNDEGVDGAHGTIGMKTQTLAPQFAEFFLSTLSHQDKDYGSYDPFSMEQTNSMVSFCSLLFAHLNREGETLRGKISRSVIEHLNNFVQNLAFPVISSNAEDDVIDEVIIFATLGQLFRLKKLVRNLTKWYPTLTKEVQLQLAKFCLVDVIAYRFLPIWNISERILKKDLVEETLALLKDVWKCIKDSGWLKIKDLTFSSAPLRSVVAARNLV